MDNARGEYVVLVDADFVPRYACPLCACKNVLCGASLGIHILVPMHT